MRYLAKYRLFLEEIEGDEQGSIPTFDPKPAEWIEKIPEGEKETAEETKETQSSSENSKSDNKKSDETKTEPSNEGLNTILNEIFSSINNAYDESSSKYFFRPYAVSALTSIFTFLIRHDKEEEAVEAFFGKNQFDKNSWWYGNVTEKISKHITITIDGENYKLIQAKEKGKDLKFIQSAIDSGNSKNKNHQMVAIKLLTEVWPELRKATLSGDNSYLWLDETGETTYEIDVDADFGVGNRPSSNDKYTFQNKEVWKKAKEAAAADVEKLDPSRIFEILRRIVLLIDGLFQDGSKDVWSSHKGTLNDDDTKAAEWLEAQRSYMKKNIFDPLKTKVDGYNYANPSAKQYYKNQIDRIDRELLGKIIEKMKGNFDLYDTVEFRLEDLSKKYKIDVEIDTDFG